MEKGANPNAQTSAPVDDNDSNDPFADPVTKETPLHLAIRCRHQDVIKVILDYKGKIDIKCYVFFFFNLGKFIKLKKKKKKNYLEMIPKLLLIGFIKDKTIVNVPHNQHLEWFPLVEKSVTSHAMS